MNDVLQVNEKNKNNFEKLIINYYKIYSLQIMFFDKIFIIFEIYLKI
jgi:hypothetical protein